MTREKVITILAIIGVTIITNTGQYLLQEHDKNRIRSEYEEQMKTYKAEREKLGELVTCYTVKKDDDSIDVGQPINKSDLQPLLLPESSVTSVYVTDPNKILGQFYKVKIHPGTPITTDMIMAEEQDDTLREVDISIDSWPAGLKVGDYIDVRLIYPKGEDYIVLPHKRIYDINASTLKVYLNERDIHFFGAALIDKFVNASYGSTIVATKYVEPGVQKPAQVYYQVPDNIEEVIENDPNIIDKIVDSAVPRDVIEAQMSINNEKLGQALGTGRTQYQAKLDQARTNYEQQDKSNAKSSEDNNEDDSDEDDSDNSDSDNNNGESEEIPKEGE